MNSRDPARLLLPCALVCSLGLLASGLAQAETTRVALLDFSTDENSYRSAQSAVDFTRLLQVRLGATPRVEWVERAQLETARRELKLSEMAMMAGAPSLRWGRWVRADWIVKGHFSRDDRDQRTLLLEVIDLRHADVLASETIRFPGEAGATPGMNEGMVDAAADGVRLLLQETFARQRETADSIRVALLFFLDVSLAGAAREWSSLSLHFDEAVEEAARAHPALHLIRFPKAYQAMGESELMFEGLIEAGAPESPHLADLYLWGTYGVNFVRTTNRFERRAQVELHAWDGLSEPEVFTFEWSANDSVAEAAETVRRLVTGVLTGATKGNGPADNQELRRRLSRAIVESYNATTDRGRSPAIREGDHLQQTVRLLETACLLDPGHAEAHLLLITTRWGFQMSFRTRNKFWSNWRASEAWGRYVERFGLELVTTNLPFPYSHRGVTNAYLSSLRDVLRGFPQHLESGDAYSDTALRSAQHGGFPRDISLEQARQWQAELKAELAERERRVEDYRRSQADGREAGHPVTAPGAPPGVTAPKAPARPGPSPISPGTRPGMLQLQPVPPWMASSLPRVDHFRLGVPEVLPGEVNPEFQRFEFPAHFEVMRVDRLARWGEALLILATDRRSSFSTDPTPDVQAEAVAYRGRVWILEPHQERPVLFEAQLLPHAVNDFLLAGDRLWLAGTDTGCLDLTTRHFRRFGTADGLTLRETARVALAADRICTAGGFHDLRMLEYDESTSQWRPLRMPRGITGVSGGRSYPGGVSYRLVGSGDWLCFSSGSTSLLNLPTGAATNLDVGHVSCEVGDASEFWFGGRQGLHWVQPDAGMARSWNAPQAIKGMMPSYTSGLTAIRPEEIEQHADGLRKELAAIRKRHESLLGPENPLNLNHRMPGNVRALAIDGEFLWVALGYNQLMLLHKPTLSIVGACRLTNSITSLAVTEQHVWAGLSEPGAAVIRLSKELFLSVPASRWLGLTLSVRDREDLVRGMNTRDQAMYAFYAGNHARVAGLLEARPKEKLPLDELFILGLSYGAFGLDQPERARACFDAVMERAPDSPWAEFASEWLVDNHRHHVRRQLEASLLARYDRDRDGVLNAAEQAAMKRDPAYRAGQQALADLELEAKVAAIMKRFDRDRDGRLDAAELTRLHSSVALYADAKPEWLKRQTIVFDILISKRFPAPNQILEQFDADQDGHIDVSELKALATWLQSRR